MRNKTKRTFLYTFLLFAAAASLTLIDSGFARYSRLLRRVYAW
jgi:hypothetical protein